MARFCRQCAMCMWGNKSQGDFVGLTTRFDDDMGVYASAVCDMCGLTLVNSAGECVNPNCKIDHASNPIMYFSIPPIPYRVINFGVRKV